MINKYFWKLFKWLNKNNFLDKKTLLKIKSAITFSSDNQEVCLIATLPKSGTWYSNYFFWNYFQLLKNPDKKPDLLKSTISKFNDDYQYLISPKLETEKLSTNIDVLNICHNICPGYEESDDSLKDKWQEIKFFPAGYNQGKKLIGKEWDLLNPKLNQKAKVVYLFRNPLDHFVSYYNHILNHINDEERHYTKNGTKYEIGDIENYILEASAIDSFIKHYHSFNFMSKIYPENVLLIRYEDLIESPKDVFQKMIKFFGIREFKNKEIQNHILDLSIELSSKDSLKDLEKKIGRTLAQDQKQSEKSHIRSGKSGKWKEVIKEDVIEKIEARLSEFGYKLSDFKIQVFTNSK